MVGDRTASNHLLKSATDYKNLDLGSAHGVLRGNRLQIGFIAKATPWIDLFSGDLEQRAVGIVASNYTIGQTTLRGQLSAAKVINTPHSVAKYTILQAEAGARYALWPTFSVDGGLRYGSQDINNAIRANQVTQATVYVGVTWAPLPGRF